MRYFIFFLSITFSCQINVQGEFILAAMNMSEQTLQDCSYCDERSDRAGTRAAANALRDFMTQNHVKIAVDSGEVRVSQNLPNERIDTGHSCSKTAEAQNIKAEAYMIPGTVQLGPEGVVYIDEIQNSIAVADVGHAVSVRLDVRVWFGARVFGKCRNVGRKTCGTDGYSEGTNKISVNLAASNVLVECIGGQQHLTFNIDAKVIDEAKGDTYAPVEVGKKSNCDLNILGIRIGSINSYIQRYANRYVNAGNKFAELRGPKLVAELERKLGANLGSTVNIKLNDENGLPRTCSSRRKRSASCVRKTCPPGFTRIGETENCQKYFGRTQPDCSQQAPNATLYSRAIGSFTLYWCHTPRVPIQ